MSLPSFIQLPDQVSDLLNARNALRGLFIDSGLTFTLDGNLIGDLGEAIAAKTFGLINSPRNSEGIDAYTKDGRSVQIKATGTARGPAFRSTKLNAQHLLFLSLDLDQLSAEVVYNGPEKPVRDLLPAYWQGQKQISLPKLRSLAQKQLDGPELPRSKP